VKRILPLLCAAALLAACGGGSNEQPAPTPAPSKSRLAAFEAGALADGLNVPAITAYWTLAEERNGNVYPVKAKLSDDFVMAARLDAAGKYAIRDGDAFRAADLAAVRAEADALARKHWNEGRQASAAALILFADAAAPFGELQLLCRGLVDLQMSNLWLVTRDARDDTFRLLPLRLDTAQLGRSWYELDSAAAAYTARLSWQRKDKRDEVGFDWAPLDASPVARKRVDGDWRAALAGRLKAFMQAEAVQFDVPADATVAEFSGLIELLSPIGYSHVEPFWPALDRPDDMGEAPPVRTLAEFEDDAGTMERLNLPSLSQWWRASAAARGVPEAGTIDEKRPAVTIMTEATGTFATRLHPRVGWEVHADDVDVLDVLRRNAGDIDLDTGLSELQVVIAMDRRAKWETFLGVIEMIKSAGAFRVFILTNDVIGPTLRLLQANIPVGELPKEVAAVTITRDGTVAEGRYTVTMLLDGAKHEVTGPRFSSSLARWSGERKADPRMLGVSLPRDEPFETLFTVLDACAWLGAPALTFG
jgi:biopolymer transport protein ExbD